MKLYGIWMTWDKPDAWVSPGSDGTSHQPIFHTPYLSVANAQLLVWRQMTEGTEIELNVREIGEDGLPV